MHVACLIVYICLTSEMHRSRVAVSCALSMVIDFKFVVELVAHHGSRFEKRPLKVAEYFWLGR